ncbi:unnamed protein product [Brassica oleracea var. botrytis]
MRQWKFRYCYWTSSQSFVFTSGWKRFGEVKTENFVNPKLKEEETKSVENKGGFMLFGVKIQ